MEPMNRNSSHNEILIVEDSATQAAALAQLLHGNNYHPIIVKNGREALTWLAEHQPSLILSDVVMPQMDGYELCRQIKAIPQLKGIPVVLLTKLREPDDILKGLECGADNFIIKPYKDAHLLSRLSLIRIQQRQASDQEAGLSIAFAGKVHKISTPRVQILNLLFAAFEDTTQKQQELEQVRDENKTLQELIPVCLACKKPRKDTDYQQRLERYVQEHAGTKATVSLCPHCVGKFG